MVHFFEKVLLYYMNLRQVNNTHGMIETKRFDKHKHCLATLTGFSRTLINHLSDLFWS